MITKITFVIKIAIYCACHKDRTIRDYMKYQRIKICFICALRITLYISNAMTQVIQTSRTISLVKRGNHSDMTPC